jgi:hypothetical protein
LPDGAFALARRCLESRATTMVARHPGSRVNSTTHGSVPHIRSRTGGVAPRSAAPGAGRGSSTGQRMAGRIDSPPCAGIGHRPGRQRAAPIRVEGLPISRVRRVQTRDQGAQVRDYPLHSEDLELQFLRTKRRCHAGTWVPPGTKLVLRCLSAGVTANGGFRLSLPGAPGVVRAIDKVNASGSGVTSWSTTWSCGQPAISDAVMAMLEVEERPFVRIGEGPARVRRNYSDRTRRWRPRPPPSPNWSLSPASPAWSGERRCGS